MMDFIKGAFSDNGTPSSSRIFAGLSTLASIGWVTHIVLHTHDLPDPVKLAAATGFCTAHYAINRFSQKNEKNDNGGGAPQQ